MSNKPLLKSKPVLYLFLFCLLSTQVWGQEEPTHNRLEYQVSVSAQLVPVFAVDAKGNPVYDLKKEELQLLVNGKPGKILYFNGYQLMMEEMEQQRQQEEPTPKEKPAPKVLPRHPERLIFLVIDNMISNSPYLNMSRWVAKKIIDKAPPGDAFIIMETTAKDGFKHIIGPEKDKENLFNALFAKKLDSTGMEVSGHAMPELASSQMGTGEGADEEAAMLGAMAANQRERAQEKYQKQLSMFSTGMGYLKHALKSTSLPKNLYLIAPGVNTAGLGNMPVTALRNLEEAAKSVNYGGSLFYLVNPIPRKKKGRDFGKSLRFMADVAGGKYISGSSFDDIASRVTKNTSAYYELAFSSRSKPGKRSRIELTCTRPGVRLTTIANTEKERPYSYMKRMERELFVLNIINGGGWSRRMLKSLETINYNVLSEETRKSKSSKNLYAKYDYKKDFRFRSSSKQNRASRKTVKYSRKEIEFSIPAAIQNKKVHLFRVVIDDATQKAKIWMFRKKVREKEKMYVSSFPDKSSYVILIDPSAPTGAYCRVK